MCVSSARSGIQNHIKINKNLRLSAFAAGVFLFIFAGLAIFPVSNTPESTQAAASKQSETTLALSTENLSLNFEIDAIKGSFNETSANVSVTTNNISGYNLSIITGNTGDNAGKLVGADKSFNPISSATSAADFSSADNTTMNGLWGYKPSKINGAANTSYLPAPTDTTTIEETSAPNTEANIYEIGLGARADFSYEAGAYTNTFIITATANPVGYTITYNKNTEDLVENMPETQSGITADATVALSDNIPTRDGYEFSGWCDGFASGFTCDGTVYQPGGDYEIYQTATNSATLYALWNEVYIMTIHYDDNRGTVNTVGYDCRIVDGVTSCEPQPESGSYETPMGEEDEVFVGWNEDPTATFGYVDETEVLESLEPATAAVTFYAIWGYPTTINFYANGGTGTMSPVVVRYNESATIVNEFTAPEGYKFKHWNTADDDSGTEYGGDFVASNIAGETLDLYAIWKESTTPPGTDDGSIDEDGGGSSGQVFPANSLLRAFELAYVNAGKPIYVEDSTVTSPIPGWRPMTDADQSTIGGKEVRFAMQDISLTFTEGNETKSVCEWAAASMVDSSYASTYVDEAQVMDIRDGKTYWVAKLADGKCWMTQNLDHDIVTTAGYYTHDNTDLGWGSDTTTTTWTPTRATIPTSSISTSGAISGWTNDYNTPYSVDTGDWYWTDTWYTSTTNNYLAGNVGDPAKFATTPYPGNGTHGHVGNYYNWSAAVASNDTSSYTADTYSDISGNPQNSICPAGWRLPTIYNSTTDSKNEYRYLLDKYGAYVTSGSERDKALTANPLYFVRGGDVYSGSLNYSGYDGYYWSSTVTSSSLAYGLGFYSGSVYPASLNYRSHGQSLRCIAR